MEDSARIAIAADDPLEVVDSPGPGNVCVGILDVLETMRIEKEPAEDLVASAVEADTLYEFIEWWTALASQLLSRESRIGSPWRWPENPFEESSVRRVLVHR